MTEKQQREIEQTSLKELSNRLLSAYHNGSIDSKFYMEAMALKVKQIKKKPYNRS